MSDWEKRAADAGIQLPEPLPSGGLYTSVVTAGNVAYTSGVVAVDTEPLRLAWGGRLGDDLSVEDGKQSAAGAMRSTLGNLRGALGGLDRIDRFLKVTGFVRVTPEFNQMPAVMDGASELLVQIFGDDRTPARSAVGVASLPGGASVELDAVVLLRE